MPSDITWASVDQDLRRHVASLGFSLIDNKASRFQNTRGSENYHGYDDWSLALVKLFLSRAQSCLVIKIINFDILNRKGNLAITWAYYRLHSSRHNNGFFSHRISSLYKHNGQMKVFSNILSNNFLKRNVLIQCVLFDAMFKVLLGRLLLCYR